MIDDIKKFFIGLCYSVGCYLVVLAVIIIHNYSRKIINTEDNVKEDVTVTDSIIRVNDSIKIKIEHLDSIKNAKVIEVQTLDNDSTLKLFYELVSE